MTSISISDKGGSFKMNFVLFSYYISSLKKRSDVASFRETEKTSLLQSSFDNNKGGNSTKLNPQ